MRRSVLLVLAAMAVSLATIPEAHAGSVSAGRAAYARQDYVRAARLLAQPAERGNAEAQVLLGMMHATGRGVPQSHDAAAYWYCLSAEKGNAAAQLLLGLAYDKGHGVPLDVVAAYKWLNLATAGASSPRQRDYAQRLRDAVASKMTREQIAIGQALALAWTARPRL